MTGASQASKLPNRNEKTRVRIPAAAPIHPAAAAAALITLTMYKYLNGNDETPDVKILKFKTNRMREQLTLTYHYLIPNAS
jgi:hypothetical protein